MESRVLIIVQNLPVPFGRRVWLECQALISAGYRVAVVCPKGSGDAAYEAVGSVELCRDRPSHRDTTMSRGGMRAADGTVVRTGPDPERLQRDQADPELPPWCHQELAHVGEYERPTSAGAALERTRA